MTEETLPRLLAVVEPIAVRRSTTDLGRTEKPSSAYVEGESDVEIAAYRGRAS
jgi:hypothetical protein